jgi:SAM-dependent methyltransferase
MPVDDDGAAVAGTEAKRRERRAYFRENYRESVERLFAAISDLYARHWGDFFHFALFENESEAWDCAFERTHRQYVDALRVPQAKTVIDLACGRGGFTHVLAESTAGGMLGIDISRAQLARCERFKRSNLRFKCHDVMRVHELGETFDAAAMLDAECYLPDKRLAVERIAQIVNPGGRFLLLAWCKREGLGKLQHELVLHPLMRYWGIPGLETPANYAKHFARGGFDVLEATDLNDRVRRNWEFGYERALKAVQDFAPADAVRLLWKGLALGPDGLRLVKEQFPAAVYLKVGFDAGFLRYTYFLAEKRSR